MEDTKEDLMKKKKQKKTTSFQGYWWISRGQVDDTNWTVQPPLCHYLGSLDPTLIVISLSNHHLPSTHYKTEICYTFENIAKIFFKNLHVCFISAWLTSIKPRKHVVLIYCTMCIQSTLSNSTPPNSNISLIRTNPLSPWKSLNKLS